MGRRDIELVENGELTAVVTSEGELLNFTRSFLLRALIRLSSLLANFFRLNFEGFILTL